MNGANPSVADEEHGWSALHCAVRLKNNSIAKLLVSKGASVRASVLVAPARSHPHRSPRQAPMCTNVTTVAAIRPTGQEKSATTNTLLCVTAQGTHAHVGATAAMLTQAVRGCDPAQIDGIPEPATALAEEKVLHIKMKQHAAAAIGIGSGKKKAGGKKKKGKKKKKKK